MPDQVKRGRQLALGVAQGLLAACDFGLAVEQDTLHLKACAGWQFAGPDARLGIRKQRLGAGVGTLAQCQRGLGAVELPVQQEAVNADFKSLLPELLQCNLVLQFRHSAVGFCHTATGVAQQGLLEREVERRVVFGVKRPSVVLRDQVVGFFGNPVAQAEFAAPGQFVANAKLVGAAGFFEIRRTCCGKVLSSFIRSPLPVAALFTCAHEEAGLVQASLAQHQVAGHLGVELAVLHLNTARHQQLQKTLLVQRR